MAAILTKNGGPKARRFRSHRINSVIAELDPAIHRDMSGGRKPAILLGYPIANDVIKTRNEIDL
jgi:hypothetical protein